MPSFEYTKDEMERLSRICKTEWSIIFDIVLMRKSMGRGEAGARGEDFTKFTLYERNRMLMEFYNGFVSTTSWRRRIDKRYPAEKIAWIDESFARVIKELGEEIRQQEEAGEVLSEWAKSYVRSECTPEMDAKAEAQRCLNDTGNAKSYGTP
jgi:hypothetical protein